VLPGGLSSANLHATARTVLGFLSITKRQYPKIKAKAAVKALTADQRSQLTAMVKRLQQDLRFLKG